MHAIKEAIPTPPDWAVGTLEMRILSSSGGDDRLSWDASNIAQLKEARLKFYELLDKGYLAFVVDDDTGKPTSEMIMEFEPFLEEVVFKKSSDVARPKKSKVVMVPPVAAG